MLAQAHGSDGHPSYPGRRKFRTGDLTNVVAVAITGDYEGVLSGVGMRMRTWVKAFTLTDQLPTMIAVWASRLTGPTRVVIDVGH